MLQPRMADKTVQRRLHAHELHVPALLDDALVLADQGKAMPLAEAFMPN